MRHLLIVVLRYIARIVTLLRGRRSLISVLRRGRSTVAHLWRWGCTISTTAIAIIVNQRSASQYG